MNLSPYAVTQRLLPTEVAPQSSCNMLNASHLKWRDWQDKDTIGSWGGKEGGRYLGGSEKFKAQKG